MARPRQSGSTSQSYYFLIRSGVSSPVGEGLTGLAFGTAGLKFSFTRDGAAAVPVTLVTQTPTGAWVSGGFCQIDAVNAPGMYRFDAPDALQAAGVASARINWTGANSVDDGDEVAFTAFDPLTNPDTTTLTAIKAKTDEIDTVLADIGSLHNLSSADVIAAVLDLADAIDTGLTPRQALRLAAAVGSGNLAIDPTTGVVTIKNFGNTKTRVTATTDAVGNRTVTATDVT